jgi:rubrerythrin
MTPVEALRLALEQEEEALKLYQRLALEHKSVKETFLFLSNEEHKHKQLLEKKISEMTRY